MPHLCCIVVAPVYVCSYCDFSLLRHMRYIADLDERPRKIVGKIKKLSPAEFLERMAARFKAMGIILPFPKGVYRFKTFEEADEWEMKHRVAAAVKRLRDHQR